MDALDQVILNKIQVAFPLHPRPFQLIGKEAEITENEAWQRVNSLRENRIIRRIGGVFDSRILGYTSTLCAAEVPEDKISILARLMQGITEITHNYLRLHPKYNLWFTIIASSQERLQEVLTLVKTALGSNEVYSLPAIEVFKIGVIFNLGDYQDEFNPSYSTSKESSKYVLTEEDKILVKTLQDSLPSSLRPFDDLARKLDMDETYLITGSQRLLDNYVMRRFGAILYHQKAGFTSNGMGVWIVPEEIANEVGLKMAEFQEVSHCYQRPTLPDWPYNLFTMIHGHTNQECQQIMANISEVTGIKDYALLFSHKELKKSSMRYFT
ncbi:MAG: transcriptional regulator [Gracilibacter sp. BRH_c7a]|nr:MAG: transcriptional regulator [Gracilibacter sp. BRH_c7a]